MKGAPSCTTFSREEVLMIGIVSSLANTPRASEDHNASIKLLGNQLVVLSLSMGAPSPMAHLAVALAIALVV